LHEKAEGFLSYRIADRRGDHLIIAAIAIPNLLRSKMAANEASAVGSIRTVNTAQVTYSSTYGTGYALTLANLED